MVNEDFEAKHPRREGGVFARKVQAEVEPLPPEAHEPEFVELLESAARLQKLVPDTVMVGGSAAAIYAQHRFSVDHDHVTPNLAEQYEMVLEALEASEKWVASVRSKPPVTILGMESGFEAGIRQLRRTRPLEVRQVELPSGTPLTIPTEEEILRIKSYLIVNRNQTRDYLDTAALADHMGIEQASRVLRGIDGYYAELTNTEGALVTVLAQRLYDCHPKDHRSIAGLARYKGLDPRWANWTAVAAVCRELAKGVLA